MEITGHTFNSLLQSTFDNLMCVNEQGTRPIYKGEAGQKPTKSTSKWIRGTTVR